MDYDLAEIVKHFPLAGTFAGAAPYGSGHINDTFRSRFRLGARTVYTIQQRINHNVFKNPPELMDNILRVTEHIRGKLAAAPGADPDRETLTVIRAADGKPYHRDAAGNTWRTYIFIDGARTYDVCTGPAQAREAAKAFGKFQQMLVDLPGPRLRDTIPYFHHTPRRFAALEAAIARDSHNRCAAAKAQIEFAMARKHETTLVTDLLESGAIPERITHNDTKLNNVMLDDADGRGVCVIDLDTVMPGSALYDFGDLVRTTTRTCKEDEPDPAKVLFDIAMFEALAQGYLETAGAFLAPKERDLLTFAGRLITFTIGIRFLTDYLAGDVYFKTHRPGQNLDRTNVQFRMIAQMEDQQERMETIVRTCAP
ncbi:MAG: aminoglycoside phosphotransferase family protein [Kiritimatiellae bacterium]|nr:aminoglycoside phosphotransferase family protein [Kiritimatiellia bacterium]